MRNLFLSVVFLLIAQITDVADSKPNGQGIYCGTRQWQKFVDEAASQFAISPSWLKAILREESAGCEYTNGVPTISPAGAMGLMQLMPGTWESLQVELHLGKDPFDPRDNILAGAKYLRELYDEFGLTGAIAAYHCGPARYTRHQSTGEALPDSTLDYISRVLADINAEPRTAPVFVQRNSGSTPSHINRDLFISKVGRGSLRTAEDTALPRLFVRLKRAEHSPEPSTADPDDIAPGTSEESEPANEAPPDPEAR